MKAIKLIAIAVIVSAFASCGVLKNTSKSSQRSSLEEIVKRDCVFVDKSSSKGEIKELSIDKGTIVTERETTTTTEKGGKSKVGIKLKDLKHGDNFLRDSAGQQVKAVLDTLNKLLTVETEIPKETQTTTTKERITEKKDKHENKESKQEEQVNKQVAVRDEQKYKDVEVVKENKETPSGKGIIWGAIGVLIIVFAILWYFGVRPRKGKTNGS